MKMKFRISGLREIEQALRRIARATPEAVQREALHDAGEIVAERARSLVPVRSGNLRDSIAVADEGQSGVLSQGGVEVFVGPQADGFYGHFVEFGTVNMAAEPFMRPAFDATRDEVMDRLGGDLWRPIEKAAKGK